MDPITDLKVFHTSRGAVASWFNENFERLRSLINSLVSVSEDKLNTDLSNLAAGYEDILQPSYTELSYSSGGISLTSNRSYYYRMTLPTIFILPSNYDTSIYNNITIDILVDNYVQNVTYFEFNEKVGWANPAYGIDRSGLYKLTLDRQPFADLEYKWVCSLSWVSEVSKAQ